MEECCSRRAGLRGLRNAPECPLLLPLFGDVIEALAERRPPSDAPDAIGLDTRVMTLADVDISRLAEDGRAASTIATYRYTAGKFGKLFGGVRVGEATPPRVSLLRCGQCVPLTAPDGQASENHPARSVAACSPGQRHRRQPRS